MNMSIFSLKIFYNFIPCKIITYDDKDRHDIMKK